MLKLREPFSQKVHLHIRQDMLQRLWDKYVPSASPEYEQIQLIYLDEGTGRSIQQPEQVQLLLNLVIRNKRMQMGLEQSPVLAKFGQKQLAGSLKRMERYYAAQLKSCDFVMYRTVKQYFAMLSQAEKEEQRYRSWQKTCGAIEKQREEYRLLSLFSARLREYSKEYSVQAMRTLEKEVIRLFSETEYRILAENAVWQEKQEFLAYLKECDEIWCRDTVRQLEKEKSVRQVFYSVRQQSAREKLVEAVTRMGQKEFCFVYHRMAERTGDVQQTEIWKRSRQEMLRFIEQTEPEVLQKVWVQMEKSAEQKGKSAKQIKNPKQMAAEEKTAFRNTPKSVRQIRKILSERMERLQEQYRKEEIKSLQKQAAVMLEKDTFQEIAEIVDIRQLTADFSKDGVSDVFDRLDQERELCRERIERHQAQAFETYREFCHQVLPKDWQAQDQADHQAERTFLSRHRHEVTREEVWNIRRWSRLLLEVFPAKQEQRGAEPSEKELPAGQKERVNQTGSAELIHTIKQINRRMQEQGTSGENATLSWRENPPKDPEIQGLLEHIRELKETQQTEFIKHLADMILILQQADLSHAVQERSAANTTPQAKTAGSEESIRMMAENLLHPRNRKLAESLLQTQNSQFAQRFFQAGHKDLMGKLLQIENGEAVRRIFEGGDKIEGISHWKIWEWGNALSSHFEYEQGRQDADILPGGQQDAFFSEKAGQEDLQTQVIHRQIELAKDRNHLQRLVRQINHRTDAELADTDVKLSMPPIQELLHNIRQLDETQYGILVKELSEVIKVQQLLDGAQKPRTAAEQEFPERISEMENREAASQISGDGERIEGISQGKMREWGNVLLSHPEYKQGQQEADVLSGRDEDVKPGMPQVQELYVAENNPSAARRERDRREVQQYPAAMYTVLTQRIQQFEAHRRMEVSRKLRKAEQVLGLTVFRKGNIGKRTEEPADTKASAYDRMEPANGKIAAHYEKEYSNTLEENNAAEYFQSEGSGNIMEYLQPEEADNVMEYLQPEETDNVMEYLQPEEADNVMEYLQPEEADNVMEYLRPEEAGGVSAYPHTASMEHYSPESLGLRVLAAPDRSFTGSQNVRPPSYRIQELEYSLQKTTAWEEEQQRTRIRMETENARIKSAQEQLDKKLKEVEQQLKKTEGAAQAKEDVKSFAEQVKRQLYEELHVEKLRRGLV